MTAARFFDPAAPARVSRISSGDDTTIAVYEWGKPEGPAILLIHGIYQSVLNWHGQYSCDALASRYRIIGLDLRGHGASGKPEGSEHYREARRWADDIAAIIDQTELQKPILVGWSYGGRVVNDYLSVYGDGRLGGIVYVGARAASGIPGETRSLPGFAEISENARSHDPLLFMKATRQFTRLCFDRMPPRREFEALVMNSMQTPSYVRRHMVGRPLDYAGVLNAIRVPTLVVHGRKDAVVPLPVGGHTAAAIAHARLEIFDKAGHSPFSEDAPRFNGLLADFVALTENA